MRKALSVLITITILFAFFTPVFAADKTVLDKAVSDTAAYILSTVKNPEVGSIGGEWAVIGLARSDYAVPSSYYEKYYQAVERYVKEHQGILHEVKYTEYSRVILGLTSAGYDPHNITEYDLTNPLSDFNKTIWQGINGPIFALLVSIALITRFLRIKVQKHKQHGNFINEGFFVHVIFKENFFIGYRIA